MSSCFIGTGINSIYLSKHERLKMGFVKTSILVVWWSDDYTLKTDFQHLDIYSVSF